MQLLGCQREKGVVIGLTKFNKKIIKKITSRPLKFIPIPRKLRLSFYQAPVKFHSIVINVSTVKTTVELLLVLRNLTGKQLKFHWRTSKLHYVLASKLRMITGAPVFHLIEFRALWALTEKKNSKFLKRFSWNLINKENH